MNIRDIANIAGVSVSTVSKVMNGKDRDISEETRRNVLKIIEENHYVPYYKFREKEGLKQRLIGLVVRKGNRERESIVLHVEEAAARGQYSLLIRYVDRAEEIPACIEDMERRQVSGLLIDSEKWIACGKLERTAVYLNQTKKFDEREKRVFYYSLSEAGKMAAERLIEEGHRNIACIVEERDGKILDGYRQAMQSRNYPVQLVWTYEGKSPKDIEQYGIRQCLNENVTAVICGCAETACCVWKFMERTRTAMPDMMSVVAIGDEKLMEVLGDGITAVALPSGEMSRDAAQYLIDLIQEEKESEIMRKFSPVIVERKSVRMAAREKQGDPIVVVGSLNMDTTIEVSTIPVNGQTQLARRVMSFPGGKGGNQAVGAGKLGGQVYMIGRLGNDIDGKQLYTSLTENHVNTDGVVFDKRLQSGKAYINVDKNAESTIVVYQGANRNLDAAQLNRCRYLFRRAKYCLLSMEIPDKIVEYTIRFCKKHDTQVVLKPSAVDKVKEELLKDIAYFVPNENELNVLVPGGDGIEKKAEILLEKGVENVIITLGSRGCYFRDGKRSLYFEGSGFEAVDTTGGADSFISALAVYLSEAKPIEQAIRFAIYASGISVTRYGVQPALPDRKAVDIYKDEIC